jgi:hypothetical protein
MGHAAINLYKKKSQCRKNPKNIPTNNWPPLRIQTLYGKEAHHYFIYIAKQVHMWIALQTKIKLTFPFQYKPANAR